MSRSPSWFRAHAGRRDKNHAAIRDGLRKLGHFVVDLAGVGDGVPDLCVFPLRDIVIHGDGRPVDLVHATCVFLELKVGKGKLRESQISWRASAELRGVRVATVRSLDEALAAVVAAEARVS